MRRQAGKTHTLYADVLAHAHRQAQADCYRCGRRERARRMPWLRLPRAQAYLALCPTCYPKLLADAVDAMAGAG